MTCTHTLHGDLAMYLGRLEAKIPPVPELEDPCGDIQAESARTINGKDGEWVWCYDAEPHVDEAFGGEIFFVVVVRAHCHEYRCADGGSLKTKRGDVFLIDPLVEHALKYNGRGRSLWVSWQEHVPIDDADTLFGLCDFFGLQPCRKEITQFLRNAERNAY